MSIENDILKRLSALMPSFSKRQKSIASFICENCDKAAFMTAEMLSEAAGVSESTVVRFAVELGYEGYPGLRKALQSVLRQRLDFSKSSRDTDKLSRSAEIFIDTLSKNAEDLKSALSDSNRESFEKLIGLINSASEVYILGLDEFYPLAEFMANRLRLIRKRVSSLSGRVMEYLNDIEENALLIVLGEGRENPCRMAMGRFAHDRKSYVALICTGILSTAKSYADCIISTESAVGIMSLINAVTEACWAEGGMSRKEKMAELERLRMEYMEDEH